jgi:hypothetical protein
MRTYAKSRNFSISSLELGSSFAFAFLTACVFQPFTARNTRTSNTTNTITKFRVCTRVLTEKSSVPRRKDPRCVESLEN